MSGALKRKLIYAVIIAFLLIPLYRLGQPLTDTGGGALARHREMYGLSESKLGEIDPASDSMRLATLGMRGVAATMLWQKSEDYRRRQEWDRLRATLDVIALLQPHFEKVWEHQAHNLTYNISVEFDDYRQRYNWVKKGTEFLMRGVRRNERAPRLVWYTGWFFGQKMGVADEKVQFRRLFSADTEFHKVVSQQGIDVDGGDAQGPKGPDNWLVGRLWMLKAYDLVDRKVPLLRKNPLNFFQDAALMRSHYGITIEEEGVLDDRALNAWQRAVDDWIAYSRRDIETYDGYTVRLGDLEELTQRAGQLYSEFDNLTTGLQGEIVKERWAALTPEELEAVNAVVSERTQRQIILASRVATKMGVSREDLVRALPKEKQLGAMQLIADLNLAEQKANKVRGYRTQTNFDYWYTRSLSEQEETTLRARRLIYEADQALDKAELVEAKEKFEESFKLWAEIYDRYPILVSDPTSDDLIAAIKRYRRVLDQDEIPEDFPLKVFAELKGDGGGTLIPEGYVSARQEEKAQKEKQAKPGNPSEKTDQPIVEPEEKPLTPKPEGEASKTDGSKEMKEEPKTGRA